MMKKQEKKDWLTKQLKKINKPKNALAQFIGIPQQHINGLAIGKYITPQRIEKISEFMEIDKSSLFEFYAGNITEEQLLSARPEDGQISTQMTPIPVVGFIQEGSGQDADGWDKQELYSIYIPYPERLINKRIFALEVRGHSMDLVYPEGSCVVCVSLADYESVIGPLESGKKVVVARPLADHKRVEITLKEYVQDEKGTFLVPRSTDLSFIPEKWDDGKDTQSQIVAVVVASYRLE